MKISVEATPQEALEFMSGLNQQLQGNKIIGGASRYVSPSHQIPVQPQPLLLKSAQPLFPEVSSSPVVQPQVEPVPVELSRFEQLPVPPTIPDPVVDNHWMQLVEQEEEAIRPEILPRQNLLSKALLFISEHRQGIAWSFLGLSLALFLFRFGFDSKGSAFDPMNLIQEQDSVEVQPLETEILDPENAPVEVPEQPAEGNIPEEEKQSLPPAPETSPTPSPVPPASNNELPDYPLPVVNPELE